MLDSIGGSWWCVYIGGPTSRASGWSPELVNAYVSHGIDRFMLTYAGRQWGGPLTAAQGQIDARQALQLAARFGYGGNYPLCLDVEQHTFDTSPQGTIEYARAWCEGVAAAGVRPGVYANPAPLRAMHGKVPADFVWAASWISHGVVRHDPRSAPGVPAGCWPAQGQRAWQYAGAYGNSPCRVLGLDVDINVADLECLANPPGVHHGGAPIHVAGAAGVVRRGDHGKAVQKVTRRLAYVRSRKTGKPYLDGMRSRFDVEAVRALKAFQAEHHLSHDGVFGPESAAALDRSVRHEKVRRARVRAGGGGSTPTPTPKPAPTPAPANGAAHFVALVKHVRELEAETDKAWQELVAFEARRTHALHKARERAVTLADVATILERIEHEVETLVEYEEHGAPPPAQPAPAPVNGAEAAPAAVAVAQEQAAPAGEPAPAGAAPYYRPPPVAPEHDGVTPPPSPPPPAKPPVHLEDMPEAELLGRIDRLEAATGRSRDVLIGRFVALEKEIAKLPHHGKPVVGPRPQPTPTPKPAPGPKPAPVKPPAVPVKIGVRNLQQVLNAFTREHLKGVTPLVVDGKRGIATKKRIKQVKYYLGYGKTKGRSTRVDAEFVRRLRRPGSPRYSNPAMLARARTRKHNQHKNAKRIAAPRSGVASFDGKPVAAWMKPYLDWARQQGWQGTLSSGWRDPVYSEHLCMGICHAPKCPGRCAGRSSNHVGRVKPAGAMDVTHYEEFGRLMQQCPYEPRIFNDLPADRVHFSATGH
jgi:hypothetical protein